MTPKTPNAAEPRAATPSTTALVPVIDDRAGGPAQGIGFTSAPKQGYQRLVRAFLEGKSPHTLRAYQSDWTKFQAYCGFPTLDDMMAGITKAAPQDVMLKATEFKNSLMEAGKSPSTINRQLAALRVLVNMMKIAGYIDWDLEIKSLDTVQYRDTLGPGTVSIQKMLDFLEPTAAAKDPKATRDRALIMLLYARALRRQEAVNTDMQHYDAARGRLSILGKKRREREWVTLGSSIVKALDAWIAIRGNKPGPVFINMTDGERLTGNGVYYIIRSLGEEIDIKTRPHGLRHTGITDGLDETNGSQRKGTKFSRHANANTMQIYDDSREDFGGEVSELVGNRVRL